MKAYEFILIIPKINDSIANTIYEKCPDSSLGATHGVHYVAFDRVGIEPLRVELDIPAFTPS